MIVIAENDYPFCVLAPGTPYERAEGLAKLMQECDKRNVEARADTLAHINLSRKQRNLDPIDDEKMREVGIAPIRVFYHVHSVPEFKP